MEYIISHNLGGLVIGVATFLIIGIFHPIVIKAEYYWGVKCWWIFLLVGLGGIVATLFIDNLVWSSLCSVFSVSSLWSIGELFHQRKRVERGWFPRNPKRKD